MFCTQLPRCPLIHSTLLTHRARRLDHGGDGSKLAEVPIRVHFRKQIEDKISVMLLLLITGGPVRGFYSLLGALLGDPMLNLSSNIRIR